MLLVLCRDDIEISAEWVMINIGEKSFGEEANFIYTNKISLGLIILLLRIGANVMINNCYNFMDLFFCHW